MSSVVDAIFGPSKPKELKVPEPTVPTEEELSLEAQAAAAEQKQRDKRRKGYSSTILTSQSSSPSF